MVPVPLSENGQQLAVVIQTSVDQARDAGVTEAEICEALRAAFPVFARDEVLQAMKRLATE